MVALEARARSSGTRCRPTIRPGAGRTQTSARRSRRRGPAFGNSSAARRTRARSPSRAASSPTTVSGSSTCRNRSRAEPAGCWVQVVEQRRPEHVEVVGDVDVDLAVVGGDEQRRVDASPARRARAATACVELRARRPVPVADGVDPVPVEVGQARARRRAAPRPPRSSRTARRARRRAPPSRTCVSAIASGCRTGRGHALEEPSATGAARAGRSSAAGRRRAPAGTAAAGSRRRSTARSTRHS